MELETEKIYICVYIYPTVTRAGEEVDKRDEKGDDGELWRLNLSSGCAVMMLIAHKVTEDRDVASNAAYAVHNDLTMECAVRTSSMRSNLSARDQTHTQEQITY